MKLTYILVLSLLLIGCTAPKPVIRKPEARQNNIIQYGDWVLQRDKLEEGDCTLDAVTSDFLATTDGEMKNGILTIRFDFAAHLSRPPVLSLSSYPVSLPVEGMRNLYTLYIPYDPTMAAHLLLEDTFITIRYQFLGQTDVREISLKTRGLVHGLAALGKFCDA